MHLDKPPKKTLGKYTIFRPPKRGFENPKNGKKPDFPGFPKNTIFRTPQISILIKNSKGPKKPNFQGIHKKPIYRPPKVMDFHVLHKCPKTAISEIPVF